MKKYNALVIIISILAGTAIAFLIGLVIALSVGREDLYPLWFILTVPFAWMFYPVYMNPMLIPFAKKTMEKNSEQQNFGKTYTHINKDTGTCGCVFRIDESSGRVAYVSALNPFVFQMCDAKELTHLKSDYIRGPLGGTRYVYLQLIYKKKKLMIPTFTSKSMFSVGSRSVQKALAKGQEMCDLIMKFQKDTIV